MPYRVDLAGIPDQAFDQLVDLGALDVDIIDGRLAAILPDRVPPEQVSAVLAVGPLTISPAVGRDDESVWVVRPRPLRIARWALFPEGTQAEAGLAVHLADAPAFGTGLHPTTALCLEVLDEQLGTQRDQRLSERAGAEAAFDGPASVLDVGTGSGVLAIAALVAGVPQAWALDIDGAALITAARNGRASGVADRLHLAHGGPESVDGTWPLVLANVLTAPLIDMAPVLMRRLSHHGRLVLSGIHQSLLDDVERAYRRLGVRQLDVRSRDGWGALLLQAAW